MGVSSRTWNAKAGEPPNSARESFCQVAGQYFPLPFSSQECLVGPVRESKSGQLWAGKALAEKGQEGPAMVSPRMQRLQKRVDTQVKSTKLRKCLKEEAYKC